MIPFGLLSSFMDSKEIRITELGEDGFRFQLAVDPAGIAPLLHSSQTSGSPLSCTRLFSYHKNRSETAPVPGIPLPAEIEIHLHPAL